MLKAPDVDVVQICVDESHDSGMMMTVYSSCLFWAWLLEFNGNLEVGTVITSACDSSTSYVGNSRPIFLVAWILKGFSLLGNMALFYHTAHYFK